MMHAELRPQVPPNMTTLQKSDRRSACWPVSATELAALIDLGLDDTTIGRYFRVAPAKVDAVRRHFGLERPCA